MPLRPATRSRARDERGFTMVVVMGATLIVMLLVAAAFAAADGDFPLSRKDQDRKRAFAAAEAGINDYLFNLNQDNSYWARCTNVPAPNALNQAWNGSGADPRRWRTVPGATGAQYAIELLPANGAPSCDQARPEPTMIDTASATFRIRSTGRVGASKRSIVATFRRRSFLDSLYFTDYETSDPTWYPLFVGARPTNPDVVTWASQNCARYWRDGRGSSSYSGRYTDGARENVTSLSGCTEIQFISADTIAGPLHTNDELLICGSPTFGRTRQDAIEVSGPAPTSTSPGWRSNGCGGGPNFVGTFSSKTPKLDMPPSNSSLRRKADPAYRFPGRTNIVFSGANMTVNGVPMAIPDSGVIYVENSSCGTVAYRPLDPYNAPAGCADVYVHGTYSKSVTIATEKDIIVDGDLIHTNDAFLGLIADNFVRVYHPVTSRSGTSCTNLPAATNPNVRIDAAILSLQHSFTVDNYYCGARMGTLTVNGAIAQKFRGPVGTSGGTGYSKGYAYDDRLKFRAPPQYLDPVQSAWRIQRFTEQVPAR